MVDHQNQVPLADLPIIKTEYNEYEIGKWKLERAYILIVSIMYFWVIPLLVALTGEQGVPNGTIVFASNYFCSLAILVKLAYAWGRLLYSLYYKQNQEWHHHKRKLWTQVCAMITLLLVMMATERVSY